MPEVAAGKTAEELFSEINTQFEHVFIEDADEPALIAHQMEMASNKFTRC